MANVSKQARSGRGAGRFRRVRKAATDPPGKRYTGAVGTSKRLQAFVLKKE